MVGVSCARRGYVPDDDRNFSAAGLEVMRRASRHIDYLINEGYDLKQATTFVGNHLMRSLATKEQLENREKKRIPVSALSGKDVWIDGFNTIITLEVLLSDSILFTCMDGTIRDLAALRGTYRIIRETECAVRMLFDVLKEMEIRSATILLDKPVSNSGRLKMLIADVAEDFPFLPDVQVRKDVDRALYNRENVITSDSVILDHCVSWINLTAKCMERLNRQGLRVWEQ